MTKTFKQAVEEIVRNRVCSVCSARHGCSTYVMNANSVCCAAFRDAEKDILSAHNAELDRIAEGMQFKKCWQPQISGHITPVEAYKLAVSECQAYIQAQKGS